MVDQPDHPVRLFACGLPQRPLAVCSPPTGAVPRNSTHKKIERDSILNHSVTVWKIRRRPAHSKHSFIGVRQPVPTSTKHSHSRVESNQRIGFLG